MFAANCNIQSCYVKEKIYSNLPVVGLPPPLCLHILIFVSEWMRREMVWSDFLPITLLPIISQSGKGSFFCLLLWLMDFRYNWRIWFWNLNLLIFYSDPLISPTVSTITTEGYLLNMSSILSFSLLTLVGPIISALGQRALMVCHFLPLMSFPPSNFHLPDHCLHELPAQIPRPFRTSRKREKEKKIKLS